MQCGSKLVPGNQFCGACGTAAASNVGVTPLQSIGHGTASNVAAVVPAAVLAVYTRFDMAIWAMQLLQCILLGVWSVVPRYPMFLQGGMYWEAVLLPPGCWCLSVLMILFEICPWNGRKARAAGNLGGNGCFSTKDRCCEPACCPKPTCISINQLTMNIVVFLMVVTGCVYNHGISSRLWSRDPSMVPGILATLVTLTLIVMHSLKLGGCLKSTTCLNLESWVVLPSPLQLPPLPSAASNSESSRELRQIVSPEMTGVINVYGNTDDDVALLND